jgi:RNA polymerase sigma-70 factor, ECF subfamily
MSIEKGRIADLVVDASGSGMDSQSTSYNYAELSQLFERRRNKLIWVAERITGNHEEAEDVVQEAALKALVNLSSFRGESRIDTWLYAIIGNAAITRLRSASWRRNVSLDTAAANTHNCLSHIPSDPHPSPEQSCARTELHEILRSEIDGLKDSYRAAVSLCDLEGCSYAEAAAALSMNLAKFKARLLRARRALHKRVRNRVLASRH